eukprot:g11621.t1
MSELVRLTETSTLDMHGNIMRGRVYCYADGKEGWATLRGSRGKCFFESYPGPIFQLQRSDRIATKLSRVYN